jgi:hypothetical protein
MAENQKGHLIGSVLARSVCSGFLKISSTKSPVMSAEKKGIDRVASGVGKEVGGYYTYSFQS